MKKRFIILLALLVASIFSVTSHADDSVRVRLDGVYQNFTALPIIQDGTTYLPARDVFEIFGFEAGWSEKDQTILGKKGSFLISIPLHASEITVSGKQIKSNSPAFIADNRAYVPLRLLTEVLGAEIRWSPLLNVIEVYRPTLRQAVSFTDENMEKALKAKLGYGPDHIIRVEDIRYLTALDLSNQGIRRIDGIQHMIWLNTFTADNNSISDLSPLRKLTSLARISINHNKVSELQSLSTLTNLRELLVVDNELVSLYGIEDLYNLNVLSISDNPLNIKEDFDAVFFFPDSVKFDVDRNTWEAPEYHSKLLNPNAGYSVAIQEGIEWVPAAVLGTPAINNEDIKTYVANSSPGLSSHIDTVYDLLHFLGEWDFRLVEDDKIATDLLNKREWHYHRIPENVLVKKTGSLKAFHIMCAQMLQARYDESGVLVITDQSGQDSYLNYVIMGGKRYVFDPYGYLKGQDARNAYESGIVENYQAHDGLKNHIHRVADLLQFVKASKGETVKAVVKIAVVDGISSQYPVATYEASREHKGTYVFYPDIDQTDSDANKTYWEQRIKILYDDPSDTYYIKQTYNPLSDPEW